MHRSSRVYCVPVRRTLQPGTCLYFHVDAVARPQLHKATTCSMLCALPLSRSAWLTQHPDSMGMQNWVKEMAAYVKGLDPNHLVTVGEEGFYTSTVKQTYCNPSSSTRECPCLACWHSIHMYYLFQHVGDMYMVSAQALPCTCAASKHQQQHFRLVWLPYRRLAVLQIRPGVSAVYWLCMRLAAIVVCLLQLDG